MNRDSVLTQILGKIRAIPELSGWEVSRTGEGAQVKSTGGAVLVGVGETSYDREAQANQDNYSDVSLTGATYRTETELWVEVVSPESATPDQQVSSLEAMVDPIIRAVSQASERNLTYEPKAVSSPLHTAADNKRRTLTIDFSIRQTANY